MFDWFRRLFRPTPKTDTVVAGFMPKDRIERTVAAMTVGESAWVGKEALDVDLAGHCYLWLNAEMVESNAGRHSIKVSKTAAGWVVDLSKCPDDVKWKPIPGVSNSPGREIVLVVHEYPFACGE